MQYLINNLRSKVNCLKSDSSPKLIEEIESILRSIRSHGAIPDELKGKLAKVLVELNRVYRCNGSDSIPYLVMSIIDMICPPKKSTGGSTGVEGQNEVRREINTLLSKFRLLGKLNFRLW